MHYSTTYIYKINNLEKNSSASLIGFFIWWNIIHHFIFYINIVAYLNSTISDLVLFLILLLFEIFAFGVYPFLIPLLLHGEKNNSLNPKASSLISYLMTWIVGFVFILFIFNSMVLYYVLFNPTIYFILSNPYIINIVMNIIGRSCVSDHPASMILNSLFIGIFPFTKLGPYRWADGYNHTWLIIYLMFQSVQIIILSLQWKLGTLFFLPNKWRRKLYDKYTKQLIQNEYSCNFICNFCTNSLIDPSLKYNEKDISFAYSRFEKWIYFELPWSHRFHPSWILQMLEENNICPVWEVLIPKNIYLD